MIEPKFVPQATPACGCMMSVVSAAIAAVWVMGSLFAPSYRDVQILAGLPMMRSFDFAFGIFTVQSSCTQLYKVPGKGDWKPFRKVTDYVVESTNGQSVKTVVARLCSAQALLAGLVDVNCDSLSILWGAGFCVACLYTLTALLLIAGSVGLCLFWFGKRSKRIRKVVIIMYWLAAAFSFVAVMQYVLLVKAASGQTTPSLLSPYIADDVSATMYALSHGFFICVTAMLCTFTVPVQATCWIPHRICDDCSEPDLLDYDDLDDEEASNLLLWAA